MRAHDSTKKICGRRPVLVSISLILSGLAAPSHSAETPASLSPLLERKADVASRLAAQAAFCSSRKDTRHTAFRGCIDWHSAVHGVWALVAYQRATGDEKHAALISSILAKDKVQAERRFLRRRPTFEMPYGRAWFLRLALDHERLTGSPQLRDMADEVAASMRDYFLQVGIDPRSGSYDSDSWALLNLIDYARHRKLDELRAEVEGWVRSRFASPEPNCPYRLERGHFMAVCSNWAALVSRIMDREMFTAWFDRFAKINGLPSPVLTPRSSHHYGLNFSRAWGLWDIYDKTGRTDVADAYASHFAKGFSPKSNWSGDYRSVGHWVAQFGMFALQPLFGPEKGR